eukprot:4711607-Prymnesium_polylepis.1
MAAVGISWTATNGPAQSSNDARKKRSNDSSERQSPGFIYSCTIRRAARRPPWWTSARQTRTA